MNSKPEKEHYEKSKYWSPLRIHGYANQLRELYELKADNVLEVGMADGFMSHVVPTFTRHRLTSLDIDPALGPNVSGSVLTLPFQSKSYDVVMCCQVLEHLPFDTLATSLAELGRVAQRKVLISVPDVRFYFATRLRLPKLGQRTFALSPERRSLGPYEYDGEHFWEIGYEGTRFKDVKKVLESTGLHIERSYRNPDLPYHCIFVMDPPR